MRLFGYKPPIVDDRARVIAAPFGERAVVGGGPGTGKTATACARVVELIQNQRIVPSAILVISFTRIAVREIAERIAAQLPDPDGALQVKIVTLDALANLLSPDPQMEDGHDDAIAQILPQIPHSPQIAALRHVIVDEAHDVVGIRADMIEILISHLPMECGLTIMSDDAQSIYEFSDRSRLPKPALPQRLLAQGMEQRVLSILYRTQAPDLHLVFTKGREIVLSSRPSQASLQKLIRRSAPALRRLADCSVFTDDQMILFRHRSEALAASLELAEHGIAHRLRLSHLPVPLPAWLGLCLADHCAPSLSASQFRRAWERHVAGTHHARLTVDQAWQRLHRTAPLGPEVHMERLRQRLRQASPPIDLCEAELGLHGPIVGTIHAAKGREAPSVILEMPATKTRHASPEECRVWFVGATRAKDRLTVLEHTPQLHIKLPSGRLYYPQKHWIELGREEDLLASGLVGTKLFATPRLAAEAQSRWAAIKPGMTILQWDLETNILLNNHMIGQFSSDTYHDLRSRRTDIKTAPSTARLYVMGLRTLVTSPEEAGDQHAPWCDSGFVLAPILTGLTPAMPDPDGIAVPA